MICVDLGSNTLRACEMDDALRIGKRAEIIVGSAAGLSEKGLAKAAMERVRAGVEQIVSEFDFSRDYKAVATEAFRVSPNAGAFFDEIERDFGVKFDIIDPALEASLTRLGIENRAAALGLDVSRSLSVDLGGASTEACFGEVSRSFRFGIVRFWEACNCNASECEKRAPAIVAEAKAFVSQFKFESVILTSGVPTTVAAILSGMDYANYDPERINGAKLTLEDFARAREIIEKAADADALVGAGRAGLVIAGICLLSALLKDAQKPFIVIDDGLREGVGVACARSILNKRRKK